MKTTNLVCNSCRETEVIEDTTQLYGDGAAKVGWTKVIVMELRPPTVGETCERVDLGDAHAMRVPPRAA